MRRIFRRELRDMIRDPNAPDKAVQCDLKLKRKRIPRAKVIFVFFASFGIRTNAFESITAPRIYRDEYGHTKNNAK